MRARVAAEQRVAPAPPAASDDAALRFGDQIGAVADQLRIDSERSAQRCFDLPRRVGAKGQCTRGTGDQALELAPVIDRCLAYRKRHLGVRVSAPGVRSRGANLAGRHTLGTVGLHQVIDHRRDVLVGELCPKVFFIFLTVASQ